MSHDFDHYMETGGHLQDIHDAFGELPGSNFSSPPPMDPVSYSVLFLLVSLQSQVNTMDHKGCPCLKALIAEDLVTVLNTPAATCNDLSPLHWLGLNPVVSIDEMVSTSMHKLLQSSLEPFHDLDGDVQSGFQDVSAQLADVNKKLDFLAHTLLSPPVLVNKPSSPPPTTPVAAPAQDVEMAHPPAPAPVPPPAPAPVVAAPVPSAPAPASVLKPHAQKPHSVPPTPAPAKTKSALAPTPTPPIAAKPSFATMAKTPAWPSLVMSLQLPVAGGPKPLAVCRSPQEVVGHLNAMLSLEGHQVTLSAAWWTVKNNLVVTAGPDTTVHHLTSTSHLISDCLATFLSANQSPPPVQAWENCK
ncbi:hypothetical protein EDB86DRAFT_3077204 [Lactarius hatsudake]|nr:hypothetical protein EDB86DRAFT_3077204 [Lactarius hatsudake]